MASVVVDTSVWVQYFRVPNSDEGNEVHRLLASSEIVMVGVVYAELLSGTRGQEQLRALQEELDALPFIEVDKETWSRAGPWMLCQPTGRA